MIVDNDEGVDEYPSSDAEDEMGGSAPLRRMSSSTRPSVEDPLLDHRDSSTSLRDVSRTTQKIYILTEDLTIVVAGFTTSSFGYALYVFISLITLGIGWLLLRWFPRRRVQLIGKPATLRECQWVAIEVGSGGGIP